jgi:hypothetical protein
MQKARVNSSQNCVTCAETALCPLLVCLHRALRHPASMRRKYIFCDIDKCMLNVLDQTAKGGEAFYRPGCKAVKSVESQPTFQRNIPPPSLLAICFMLACCSAYFSTLKMEAICSSETSDDSQRATWRYIPEDGTLLNINGF